MAEMRQVSSKPAEPEGYAGPTEMHATRKYGKFHGHIVMHDGAEHHIAPQPTMQHAHEALGMLVHPQAEEPESEGEESWSEHERA